MIWYTPWNRHPEAPGDDQPPTAEDELSALLTEGAELRERLRGAASHDSVLDVLGLLGVIDKQAKIMGASDERPQN